MAVNSLQLAWHAVHTHSQSDRVLRHVLQDSIVSMLNYFSF